MDVLLLIEFTYVAQLDVQRDALLQLYNVLDY
jgi:hypothetical protein